METKSDLEATVKLHRESVQTTRGIEAEIEVHFKLLVVHFSPCIPS